MATNFYLDNRSTAKGENPLRLAVTICGARFGTSAGLSILPKFWDANTQAAKAKKTSEAVNCKGYTAARFNAELAKIAAYWQQVEGRTFGKLTPEELRTMWAAYRGKDNKARKSAAADLLQQYAKSEGKAWADGTRAKWGAFYSLVEDSAIFATVSDLANADKAAEFVEYLRTEHAQKDTTAAKYFAILCRVVRWAEKKGIFAPNTADTLRDAEKFTKIAQPIIYLETAELLRFLAFDCNTVAGQVYEFGEHKHQYNPETLGRVRDLFCFCALTSLRLSDGLALTWAQVSNNEITVTTQKTADRLTIKLNEKARAILSARREALGGCPQISAKVFARVNVVTMNEYIKGLGFLCGVSAPITRTFIRGGRKVNETRPKYELLSSHAARRTFIVTALSLGIAPAVVMKFTGHSNFAAMRPYIDITENAQAEAMAKFDTL